jgi:hypothetical protein
LSVRFRPGNDITLQGAACTERLDRINVTAYAGDLCSYPTQVQVTSGNRKIAGLTLPLESVSLSRSRIGLHGLRRKPIYLELHRADIGQRRVHTRLVVPE